MKKILIIIMLFLCTGCINAYNHEDYSKYSGFKTFKKDYYDQYEIIRQSKNCSYLEAINYFNYPYFLESHTYTAKPLFIGTSKILVNSNHQLENTYAPSDLDKITSYNIKYIFRKNETLYLKKDALLSLEKMFNAMKLENLDIYVFSAYRDYNKQSILYIERANDFEVASPGNSEHQTGYAVDLSTINDGLSIYFKNSKEYKWLLNNSYKYGFILRYPNLKTNITGYLEECWHFRYIGQDALKIKNNITYEEYLFKNYELF